MISFLKRRGKRTLVAAAGTFVAAGLALAFYAAFISGSGSISSTPFSSAPAAQTFNVSGTVNLPVGGLQPKAVFNQCLDATQAPVFKVNGSLAGGIDCSPINVQADLSHVAPWQGTLSVKTVTLDSMSGLPAGCPADSLQVIWPNLTSTGTTGTVSSTPGGGPSLTWTAPNANNVLGHSSSEEVFQAGDEGFSVNSPGVVNVAAVPNGDPGTTFINGVNGVGSGIAVTQWTVQDPTNNKGTSSDSGEPVLDFVDDGTNQNACADPSASVVLNFTVTTQDQ